MDVTVIIATRNRAKHLATALCAIQSQECLQKCECETIVVDNGSTDNTAKVARQAGCAVTYLYEPIPGKSLALNRALQFAKGRLLAFTDDDVVVGKRWVAELKGAADEFEDAVVFCGPVIPQYLGGVPDWLAQHEFGSILFAHFDLPFQRGELPNRYLPFGPNFMVRRCAISSLHFRADLGPSESSGALMGEDSQFLCDLRRQMGSSRPAKFVYLPSAQVAHIIEKVRTEPEAMWDRFFSYGRTHIARRRSVGTLSPGFGLRLSYSPPRDAQEAFERAAEINFYFGQLYEATRLGEGSLASRLRCLLNPSLMHHMQHLLGPSAQQHASLLYGHSAFQKCSNPATLLQCERTQSQQ